MSKNTSGYFIGLFVIAVAIRLFLSWSWIEVADTANYRRVAETLGQGGQLYRDTPGLYPYPPIWAGVELCAHWLSQHTSVPFLVWIELLPTLADAGIVMLLFHATRSVWLAAAYGLNPLSILITSLHGQFDALPIFFLMLACYLFEIKSKPYSAAASLMLAVALKSFPVVMLPLFLIRLPTLRAKVVFTFITLAPVAALLLPFLTIDAGSVVRELFGYQGVADHGWLAAIREASLLWSGQVPPIAMSATFRINQVAFGVFYLAYLIVEYRRLSQGHLLCLAHPIATVFLGFYVLYAGLSSQYLMWVLPFLILSVPNEVALYSALAMAAVWTFYSFRWPEIVYRAKLQVASERTLQALYIFSTTAWWLGCLRLLRSQIIVFFQTHQRRA